MYLLLSLRADVSGMGAGSRVHTHTRARTASACRASPSIPGPSHVFRLDQNLLPSTIRVTHPWHLCMYVCMNLCMYFGLLYVMMQL